MKTKTLVTIVAAVWLAITALIADAAIITKDHVVRGFYRQDGTHNNAFFGNNYLAGESVGTVQHRNWLRYDLSGVEGTVEQVVHATLLLDVPIGGYKSTSGTSETYTLFDISPGNAASLGTSTGNATGMAIWNDLGSGIIYGSHAATNADNGTTISIDLNSAALAAINASINASLGSNFALGGAITTLNASDDEEFLFAFTHTQSGVIQFSRLRLTTQLRPVPEPATLLLLAGALLVLTLVRTRVP